MWPTEPDAAGNFAKPSTPGPPSASERQPAVSSAAAPTTLSRPAPLSEPAASPEPVSSPEAASSPEPAAAPIAAADCPAEPPVLAYLPGAPCEELIMATVVADSHPPVQRVLQHAAPEAGGEAAPERHSVFLSELGEDPFRVAAQYAKALFSQEAQEALFASSTLDKIYSVPRRFDLATLFVVSTAFAFLFTLLGYLGFSSPTKLAWCLYFSAVGVAQAILYNGRAPRLASVLAGGLLMPILLTPVSGVRSLVGVVFLTLGLLIAGLPAGYIVGTLIGGVFLVADKLRNWIARRRAARAA